ncbi:unnamed protein product [Protopolystoma xenopodis]|uniref:Cyclic nucleotide-binding domain-containing protein n=1 Tax=Protopolystoma xenopodis TaxID=117903 RepID=A0A448XRX6_9PLAT|nr:unnamed protein product [Protopolystoma xenopodis]
MQQFPEELRGDIALHLNREMLSLTIFTAASPGCRKSLAQLIQTCFATPGENLVHRGDVIKYIYFVCSGSLEILDEEGTVVALLGRSPDKILQNIGLTSAFFCLTKKSYEGLTGLKNCSLHY